MAVNGIALATVATGAVLVYAGVTGKSVLKSVQAIVSGKTPSTLPNANPIVPTTAASGGASSSPGSVQSAGGTANELTAAKYLMANGYSAAAAAGIASCIAGESSGNPESIGDQGTSFGLIQEHGSQYSGLVTGNPSADLQAQLPAIIAYNNAQGSGLISMLNGISDPVQAAQFYSQRFERPAVTNSDVNPSVARSVYAQLTGG